MSSLGKVGWKQLAIFGSVFLVAVGVPFVLVGFYATDHPFDWELASIFGTAVGTTLLALATGPTGRSSSTSNASTSAANR